MSDGVKLPRLSKKLLKSGFRERCEFLSKVCRRIWHETPDGMTRGEAESAVEHFRPLFSEIELVIPMEGRWGIQLEWYTCPNCDKDFDAKELEVYLARGRVQCPHCRHEFEYKEIAGDNA